MTDIVERRTELCEIRNIAVLRDINAVTNKEKTFVIIVIVCLFLGMPLIHYFPWIAAIHFSCLAGGYIFMGWPLIKLYDEYMSRPFEQSLIKHRAKYWNVALDQSLRAYQPLNLQAWLYFQSRVRKEGMSYEACDERLKSESVALYEEPKPEWSFLDDTSVEEGNQSEKK